MNVRVAILCAALLAPVQAQTPAFEVASIKPLGDDPQTGMFIPMEATGGMLRFPSITLLDAVRAAYRVRDFQVQGPGWIRDARYEITAKIGTGTMDQIPEMLQSLLAERFKLELVRESHDHAVYALVVDKDGSKLKAADAIATADLPRGLGPDGKPRPVMMYQTLSSGIQLTARSATLATVTEFLSRFMDRPLVDMTGLSGQYELTLPFVPEILPGGAIPKFPEPGPTLFDAVKALGLKLEARKLPIEMLTVFRAEKTPAEN